MIGLGKDAPKATLTVAWYRLAGIGQRKHLFSHAIPVGPGALAYSQGVAKGGLAPGLYETVATLGERQVRTPWVVRRQGSAELVSAPASASAESVLISGRSAQRTPEWDLPSPGESGLWEDETGPAAGGSPSETCTVDDLDASVRPLVDVDMSVSLQGPCSAPTLTATVAGPPTQIATVSLPLAGPVGRIRGQVDPCKLSGGSDLPGTVVRIEVTGSASAREDFTLPDHGEFLIAGVESIPAAGSNVAAGDRIKLHAIGAIPLPPAQGIKVLYVDDGNDLIESVGNKSGATEPLSCHDGRYYAELEAEYQVPADPPPVIEICANAEGFDGVRAKGCIEFYTGEVWEGTANSTITTPSPNGACGNPTHTEAAVRLVVAGDGSVKGEYDVTGCGVSEPHAEWTGTSTDAGFLFPQLVVFTNGSLIPKVSPTHARATLTNIQGTTEWATTWDLTCKTCEG